MEDDATNSDEEDIFANLDVPASETESEYENSEEESNNYGKSRGKKQKNRAASVQNEVEVQDRQDSDDDEAFSNSRLLKGQNTFKRKESPVVPQDRDSKKPKSSGSWLLHAKYRDILNNDIADIACRNIVSDNISIQDSQIGSSIWTSLEKARFFNSLSRLGPDNLHGISQQIVTKSEPEVSEYLSLLRKSFISRRSRAITFELPDFPAAVEISEKCCEELEKTADAFAALQQEHEIALEKNKWGESWLLTPETSHWLNKKRAQKNGSKAIDDVLPAANLFDLDIWLELTSNIFMNPGPEENENNWHNLREDDVEVPAIRATAFEDFHNLAVWLTKKLVSTTLLCAMSRLRAMRSTKTKVAEINAEDISAAVDILKIKHNSQDFWRECPRRCKLEIVNDDELVDQSADQDFNNLTYMSYDDAEAALSSTRPRPQLRSHSRSINHAQSSILQHPSSDSDTESHNSKLESDRSSALRSPSPTSSLDISHSRNHQVRARAVTEHIASIEAYTESLDQQASLAEELRLWSVLKKDVPEGVLRKVEEFQKQEELKRPKKREEEKDDRYEWRNWVGFKQVWQDQRHEPLEEEFENNRTLKRRSSAFSSEGESGFGLSTESVQEYSDLEENDRIREDDDGRELEGLEEDIME